MFTNENQAAAGECIAEALDRALHPVLKTVDGQFFHGTNAVNAGAIVAEQRWLLPDWEEQRNEMGPSVCVFCPQPPDFRKDPLPAPEEGWGSWAAMEYARFKIARGQLFPPPAVVCVELKPTPTLDLTEPGNFPFLQALRAALRARTNLTGLNPRWPLEHILGFAVNLGRAAFAPAQRPAAIALPFALCGLACQQNGLAIMEPEFIVRARPGLGIA